MLMSILKYLFILNAAAVIIMIIGLKLRVSKISDNMKKSDYVAGIAVLFFLYIILALILAILSTGIKNKLVMFLFAISPFIIGKLAAFKTEKFYSIIQMLVFFLSIGYILII